jgi:hypothetical protein
MFALYVFHTNFWLVNCIIVYKKKLDIHSNRSGCTCNNFLRKVKENTLLISLFFAAFKLLSLMLMKSKRAGSRYFFFKHPAQLTRERKSFNLFCNGVATYEIKYKEKRKKRRKRLEQEKREEGEKGMDSQRIHILVRSNLVKANNWMALS